MQDFDSFSMMFYYIITTTYQKTRNLFCTVYISGLLHSNNAWQKKILEQQKKQLL